MSDRGGTLPFSRIPVVPVVHHPTGRVELQVRGATNRLPHSGLGTVFGQGSCLAVEAHDVAQHAPKFPVQQIAALGKYGIQAGPCQRPEYKNAAKRPEANKGGREENRPGIAS